MRSDRGALDAFVNRLKHLRLDKARGPVKPYKPLLICAVVIMIAKGKLNTRFVFLDGGLTSVWKQLLARVHPNWETPADIRYPFRHLESDGVWRLVPIEGAFDQLATEKILGVKARKLLRHVACAELDEAVFAALAANPALIRVFNALADAYPECLPPHSGTEILRVLGDASPPRTGRSEDLTERAIEQFLEQNWRSTPFAKQGVALSSLATTGLAGRQVLTPVSTIDLLGYQPQQRTFWIVELKRGRPADAVVGQVSRYLGWVASERAQYGERAVGAIVARAADDRLRYAVGANPNLTLWTYNDELEIGPVVIT